MKEKKKRIKVPALYGTLIDSCDRQRPLAGETRVALRDIYFIRSYSYPTFIRDKELRLHLIQSGARVEYHGQSDSLRMTLPLLKVDQWMAGEGQAWYADCLLKEDEFSGRLELQMVYLFDHLGYGIVKNPLFATSTTVFEEAGEW